MKKKIFGAVLITVVAVAAGWNFNQIKNEMELSDLALANMEALARNESTSSLSCEGWLGTCKYSCSKCGTSWSAIGSTQKGSHSCSY